MSVGFEECLSGEPLLEDRQGEGQGSIQASRHQSSWAKALAFGEREVVALAAAIHQRGATANEQLVDVVVLGCHLRAASTKCAVHQADDQVCLASEGAA